MRGAAGTDARCLTARTSLLLLHFTILFSPISCSGHGSLVSGMCHCASGYLKSDCSLLSAHSAQFDVLSLHWEYDESSIYVQMSASAVGWIGLILGAPDDKMGYGGDCWMGWVDSNTGVVHLQDRMALGLRAVPSLDDQQDLTDVVGYVAGGITRISFTRALSTGDLKDIAIPGIGASMSLAWAIDERGPGSLLHQHSDANGGYRITWQPQAATPPSVPSAPTLK
jgi:hypothetical protein